MKRLFLILFSLLFLFGCSAKTNTLHTANSLALVVEENEAFFRSCAEEMAFFGEERIYVAMEEKEAADGETLSEEEKKPRLVSYLKESGDREEIENELLEKALNDFGFKIIFFQTASDGRKCVIFSFAKENENGIQNGFYYSFDSLPCAWWGRKGDLKQEGNRYLQIQKSGSAWYYTVEITNGFYYFEKNGDLVA